MKIAVVGHLELCSFAKLDHLPSPGEIEHASEYWEEVGGGGAVAAMQIYLLNGSCTFFTVVGDDEEGRQAVKQLQEFGINTKYYVEENQPTTKTHIQLDPSGDRTGDLFNPLKPKAQSSDNLDWEDLKNYDAIYFASGDRSALEYASECPAVVSTARIIETLKTVNFELSALVMSQRDESEKYLEGALKTTPKYIVSTNGSENGFIEPGGAFKITPVSNKELNDTYGCGDSFAAGLTYGLAKYSDIDKALEIAINSGANAAKRNGAFH